MGQRSKEWAAKVATFKSSTWTAFFSAVATTVADDYEGNETGRLPTRCDLDDLIVDDSDSADEEL